MQLSLFAIRMKSGVMQTGAAGLFLKISQIFQIASHLKKMPLKKEIFAFAPCFLSEPDRRIGAGSPMRDAAILTNEAKRTKIKGVFLQNGCIIITERLQRNGEDRDMKK
jgi:hypothetical protein